MNDMLTKRPMGPFMMVLDDITKECAQQDEKWGGPSHDDQHAALEWVGYILEHVCKIPELRRWDKALEVFNFMRASIGWPTTIDPLDLLRFRKQMIRVAALAVSAAMSVDRKLGMSNASGSAS